MVQQVKDPALSLLWLGSQLWHNFDLWPWKFPMLWARPKRKKREKLQAVYISIIDTQGDVCKKPDLVSCRPMTMIIWVYWGGLLE